MEYLNEHEKLLMKECASPNIALIRECLRQSGNANVMDEDRTSLLHVVF